MTTGIFIVQFALSIFFGDIDADADIDTDISSMVSFKGLTHFGVGFGWFMYLQKETNASTFAIGLLIGLLFVFSVWYLYKKAYQLQQVNHSENPEQLIDRECTIYLNCGNGKYTVQMKHNGAMRESNVISQSGKDYRTGEKTTIIAFKEGTLFIK